MDTPGFNDHELRDNGAFREVAKGIHAFGHNARIVGVLLVLPMNPGARIDNGNLVDFVKAFVGRDYLSQVTVVTNFWTANSEQQKQKFLERRSAILDHLGKNWSVPSVESISHYEHGQRYKNGEGTGEFLD